MRRIYYRNKKKGGRIWFVDYAYQGRRIRKKIGPSKRLAELALKDIEIKIAKQELGFAPSDISLDCSASDLRCLFLPSPGRRIRGNQEDAVVEITCSYSRIHKV
ncbi:MAG: hypothetical protein DRP46_06085 [Candidatus Zixiibacteriota bacterium]|nr:MAG: hypothetical protein DRP46_06085 [candidate division Zixibacteria bacterium]